MARVLETFVFALQVRLVRGGSLPPVDFSDTNYISYAPEDHFGYYPQPDEAFCEF
jgi:hypothetical protein